MFYFCQMLALQVPWQICLRNHCQSVVDVISKVASVFYCFNVVNMYKVV